MNQMYAVGGRRVQPNYVDIINQQTAYLPAIYRQRADEEYQQATLGLREKEIAEQQRQFEISQELEREALEEQKKQAKRANIMGIANLGLKTGLGLAGEKMAKAGAPAVAETVAKEAIPKVADTVVSRVTGGNVHGLTGKATDWGKWGSAVTSWEPWAGGTAGGLAANILGKDEGRTKKALIGAGTGAAVSALVTGGDIYKSVVGGILGGLGGLF